LRTGDATWPLLAPMVKSAVRGMDAVQAFAKKEWSYDVASFTVTGASKRGWTTWLTAAVDPRVKALAPMVIDTLNMASQTALQLTSWGKFSDQIHDYTERGLQAAISTPKGQVLLKMIDPYHYRHEIQQPKLIILGTNDRYWPLEALNLYWNDLPGKKYVLYTPNQGHGIKDITRVVGSLSAFHRAALGEMTLPVMDWQFTTADGATSVVLTSDVKPQSVAVWTTESKTRDFRDSLWKSESVAEQGGKHTYTQVPAAGVYRAMFLEGVFDGGGTPYYLSTNVRVVSPAK
jgi:PhoPQ-activated pathogenicity-related protein